MKKTLLALLFPILVTAQGFTSYFTGNTNNITIIPEPGVCLMGGATEHDNAMKWLLQKANGGDVVVLRSTGSNGYNNYLYSELGIQVNSVETLVISSAAGATNPYVLEKVANAELIWFAGGDQWNYVSFFRNNALEDLINNHINVKHAPIGGTSAGMAILGAKYFSAQNGSLTSAQALANPFHPNVTLGSDDFLSVPILQNVITDTHFDNPDRRGRLSVFLARYRSMGITLNGIACNEYVAVCIGADGIAHVYGDYPNYPEFAYFVKPNCDQSAVVQTCQANLPLSWNHQDGALMAYKIPGTMNGTNTFDLNNWDSGIGTGGQWESWNIDNGILSTAQTTAGDCVLANQDFNPEKFAAVPNPFSGSIQVRAAPDSRITIFNSLGQTVYASGFVENIETSGFSAGLYFLKVQNGSKIELQKMVKK